MSIKMIKRMAAPVVLFTACGGLVTLASTVVFVGICQQNLTEFWLFLAWVSYTAILVHTVVLVTINVQEEYTEAKRDLYLDELWKRHLM